jgi:hypothetical protein
MSGNISNSYSSSIRNSVKTIYVGGSSTSEVENNSFNVYGVNGKFHWTVHGKRTDIECRTRQG